MINIKAKVILRVVSRIKNSIAYFIDFRFHRPDFQPH